MRKKLLLIVLLINAAIGYTQKELSKDYSYTVSSPYKVFDADEKLYFHRDNQILTVKVGDKEVLLQKLKSDGDKVSFLKSETYDLKKIFPKNFHIEGILEFGDKYYFFYSSWDGDNEKEQLYSKEIDFEKGEFSGEDRLLFKVDGRVSGRLVQKGFSMETQDKFNFLLSGNKDKMLIKYRKRPEVKRDTKSWDIIGINAFEPGLKLVWNNEFKMPYTERRMDVLDYAIDKEANAYILAKVYHDDSNDDKKNRKDEDANYHIEMFRIPAGKTDIDITKIDVNDKFVHSLWIHESDKDYMVCAGLYKNGKERKKIDSADGIMVFKIKKTGGIYDSSFNEIPLEVLNDYEKNKTKKKNIKKDAKGEAQLEHLRLNKLQINSDGSIVVMGEQYYITYRRTQKYTYTYYNHDDIIIAKIDPAGRLAWINKLPKRQIGTNGQGGMSFKHFFANNHHYLLFLDNVKNFNLPIDKTPAVHTDGQGGYFTSYKINDTTGESENSSVFNIRDVEDMTVYQFSIDRILQTGDDEFAVEVYKKKKEDVMIKVKMKK